MKNVVEFQDGHIALFQKGPDNFTVQYGLEVRGGLSYVEAAHQLGECLFHSLACDGKLDNRTKKEARQKPSPFPDHCHVPNNGATEQNS